MEADRELWLLSIPSPLLSEETFPIFIVRSSPLPSRFLPSFLILLVRSFPNGTATAAAGRLARDAPLIPDDSLFLSPYPSDMTRKTRQTQGNLLSVCRCALSRKYIACRINNTVRNKGEGREGEGEWPPHPFCGNQSVVDAAIHLSSLSNLLWPESDIVRARPTATGCVKLQKIRLR